MINEVFIPQASDVDVEITVTNADTGAVEDIVTDISNVVVFVYHLNGTLLGKFSVTSSPGYSPLDSSAGSGKLSFRLTTAMTKLALLGKYTYEVLVRKTDGSLSDGNYDRIAAGIYLMTIIPSYTAINTLP